MLVRSSSSVSCRGWEENDSDLIETDHKTLREFIIVDVLMEDWRCREKKLKRNSRSQTVTVVGKYVVIPPSTSKVKRVVSPIPFTSPHRKMLTCC